MNPTSLNLLQKLAAIGMCNKTNKAVIMYNNEAKSLFICKYNSAASENPITFLKNPIEL